MATIIKAHRETEEYRKALHPYAAAIGELAISWNSLHGRLSFIFSLAVKSSTPDLSSSIWYSTDSDYTQRKMLRAAIEKTKQITDTQRAGIVWLLNKIDESLRHSRNDIIHAPLTFLLDETISMIVDFTSPNPRAISLWQKTRGPAHLRDYLEEQIKFADALANYADMIFKSLAYPERHAWPDKPKLPHAHRKKNPRESSRQNTAK